MAPALSRLANIFFFTGASANREGGGMPALFRSQGGIMMVKFSPHRLAEHAARIVSCPKGRGASARIK